MATDNENLRSILGIPTPKADPDNATLRAVLGIPALQSADGASNSPGGVSFSPSCSPLIPASFSPTHSPSLLMGG